MRLLLDTHIVLWCLQGKSELPAKAFELINDAEEVYVSAASFWEMAIKVPLGKLKLDIKLQEFPKVLSESGYETLAIKVEHAVQVAGLPPFHRDPFDRMLIAQSIMEPLQFVTHDAMLTEYADSIILV